MPQPAPPPPSADDTRWRAHRSPGHPVLGALSPSRAGDFTTCPLLYRYRVIDRLPEPPSAAAARGTMVHEVLERLFDLPPDDREPAAATALLPEAWARVVRDEPEVAALAGDDVEAWLADAEPLLRRYFSMEDPRRLQPAFRELFVEHQLPEGPLLRGIVDRVDIAAGAGVRIVDYKTGRAPGPRFEQKAMFQLRFYALVVWRMTGELPALLQLTYLGSGDFLRLTPDPADLESFERTVRSLWRAIEAALEAQQWSARPGPLCAWCSFQEFCPAKGGSELPLPARAATGSVASPGGDGTMLG